jgi:hypothetical protein
MWAVLEGLNPLLQIFQRTPCIKVAVGSAKQTSVGEIGFRARSAKKRDRSETYENASKNAGALRV